MLTLEELSAVMKMRHSIEEHQSQSAANPEKIGEVIDRVNEPLIAEALYLGRS